MSNLALRVENLGKMYRIGGPQEKYQTFRDTIVQTATAPFRRARDLMRGQAYGAAGLTEEIWALKNVGFEVQHGEAVGIIGRNGAGKSTLLKILSRITEPTEGYAEIYGRVGSLLEVGTGFHPELTGRENVYLNGAILGMSRAEIDRKFDEIVDFSGVEKFIDTPVKHYSSGMGLRLGFAVAAHLEPEILVIDEVLAVGDIEFQKKCLGKMGDVASEGRTVLFVSHNMATVQSICETGIVLDRGRLVLRDSATDAVSSYLLDARNKSKQHLNERTDRRGSQALQFTSVRIVDLNGNELQNVLSGQDVKFEIGYASDFEVDDAEVTVAFLVQEQGYGIINLNSRDSGYSRQAIFNHGIFECIWEKFNLIQGIYDCTLFCEVNGEVMDWVEAAFTIEVQNGDFFGTGNVETRTGKVLVSNRWSGRPA